MPVPKTTAPHPDVLIMVGQLLEASKAASDNIRQLSDDMQTNAQAWTIASQTLNRVEKDVTALTQIVRTGNGVPSIVATVSEIKNRLADLEGSLVKMEKSADDRLDDLEGLADQRSDKLETSVKEVERAVDAKIDQLTRNVDAKIDQLAKSISQYDKDRQSGTWVYFVIERVVIALAWAVTTGIAVYAILKKD